MDLRPAAPAVGRWLTDDARRLLADVALAAAVVLIGQLGQPAVSSASDRAWYGVVVAGCSIAMLARSRMPHVCLTALAGFLLLHLVLTEELSVFAAAVCLVAAYISQTQLEPPGRWVYLALTYTGAMVAILTPDPMLGESRQGRWAVAAFACAMITVAALAGTLRRRSRARVELALDRVAILQAQQHTERRLAASEERTRIAREVHDILGHSLGAIAVQAEGARYVLTTDAAAADRALADIGRLSRGAVGEVQELVDVLRADDEPAALRPTPTLRDLPELVGTFQHPGGSVRLLLDGETGDVPAHVGVAAYRIVQEALTNVLKHAGRVPVMIRVRVAERRTDLLVLNGRPTRPRGTATVLGHGLTGMKERVRALGGTFDAGPDTATGGWRVAATLPWERP
ncbi:sensor histidine kinase [Promicromonospora iranensis]|uniref:histidine kinase n=1 Tax=Promicromonospora iranensis TaxID=1105144 RepID=A0ABU2CJA2_9MICO|nr:histidine kinase [Promicromonospora iranensis]MDR7381420.1 signal transduction histidine kinase [Promicromonospora iranensis]